MSRSSSPGATEDSPRVLHGPGSLGQLADIIAGASARRVLVLSGPSRRHVDRVQAQLCEATGAVEHVLFDGALVHVPGEVVQRARAVCQPFDPDVIVAIGGGAATGLGKMLRRTHDATFIAVPTTFSGSEMTQVWGSTEDGEKVTGREPRVRPDVVIHDAQLLAGMPLKLAVASGLNSLAHPISALSTGALDAVAAAEAAAAITQLHGALDALIGGGVEEHAHDRMLAGTALSGRVIDRGGLGLHHRVAHFLGGRFGLPHSGLHSVLLPHFTATLRSTSAWQVTVDASGCTDPDRAMFEMLIASTAAHSLAQLGMSREDLRAVSGPLRAMGDGVEHYVAAALHGDPPAA